MESLEIFFILFNYICLPARIKWRKQSNYRNFWQLQFFIIYLFQAMRIHHLK
jgi:hypothetical protein